VPSPLGIYTGFKEHSSKAHSFTYPSERLADTVGTAVTGECGVKGGSIRVN